jgi:hypothetical protein
MERVQSNVISRTIRLTAADLVNAAVGAQDAVVIYNLSEGWEVESAVVETEEDPGGTGTRTLSLGITGAATTFFSALDVEATGYKAPTVARYRATAPTDIIATLTTGTSNPTTGVIRITLILHKVAKEA